MRTPLAVLLLAAVLTSACQRDPARPASASSPAGRPSNVLLITIDTLRADRLGRGLTPTLDRLAAGGLTFARARTAVPLTLPSHATILSGLLPPRHGLRENGAGRFDLHPTLATILRARGYHTGAVVGAFVLGRQFGLDAGFQTYDDAVPRSPESSTTLESQRRAAVVTDAALKVLHGFAPPDGGDRTGPRAPWFLWAHYYDPHAPYDPPPAFLARTHGDPYDGEVAYTDSEVGRLLESLPRSPGRDTLVVVAADHGESLGEHGEATHGMLLFEGALRVPLLFARLADGAFSAVRPPAPRAAGVRGENASLADLAPTTLALLAITPPQPMDGVSLLGGVASEREVYIETRYPRVAGWSALAGLVSGRWKLVTGGKRHLFDLEGDAAEAHDASAQHAAAAAGMESRLAALRATSGGQAPAAVPPEVRERLRALGYVAPTTQALPSPSAPDPADRIGDWREFERATFEASSARTAGRSPAARQAALGRLQALASRNPDAQVFVTEWARALAGAGRRADALRAYRRAAERWPTDATLLHDLAVAARDAGQADEARRAEEAALAIEPRYAAATNGLGLIEVDAGRVADAAARFERAVTLEPGDPAYWTNLGNARRALGRMDAARQAYEAALGLDATWPDAANGIGVLEVQAGRAAAAIAWFERALGRVPAFVEARLNLGIACQESGDGARARASYEAVLKAPPSFARERQAAAQLLRALPRSTARGAGRR